MRVVSFDLICKQAVHPGYGVQLEIFAVKNLAKTSWYGTVFKKSFEDHLLA